MTDQPIAGASPTGVAYREPSWLASAFRSLRFRYFPPKSNLERFAETELARLMGDPDGDDMQRQMNRHLLRMVRTFSREGHSGFSASYAIGLLQKLLRYEPITPLTGDDAEWNDIGEMNGSPCWQNNRCPRIFKDGDGRAYDIDGKVFVEPSGASFTSRNSRVYITFPYRPQTEVVYVDAAGKRLKRQPKAAV